MVEWETRVRYRRVQSSSDTQTKAKGRIKLGFCPESGEIMEKGAEKADPWGASCGPRVERRIQNQIKVVSHKPSNQRKKEWHAPVGK